MIACRQQFTSWREEVFSAYLYLKMFIFPMWHCEIPQISLGGLVYANWWCFLVTVRHRLIYGVRSSKFIWAPSGQLCSLAETPQGRNPSPHPPTPIWVHIRGRCWSAKIDDICCQGYFPRWLNISTNESSNVVKNGHWYDTGVFIKCTGKETRKIRTVGCSSVQNCKV